MSASEAGEQCGALGRDKTLNAMSAVGANERLSPS
jgi:hypothetical protein